MNMYYVFGIDNRIYHLVLDELNKIADRFCLVEPIIDSKDYPTILPEPKERLEGFLIEKKRVCLWPGTKLKTRNKNKEAVQHFYKCNKKSIDILKKYLDFFEYEDQMDIAFFKMDVCVLYTISHEEIVAIDMDFWGEFFDGLDCKLIKMKI